MCRKEMSPILEMEADYPGEVPTEERNRGQRAPTESSACMEAGQRGGVGQRRCPKAEIDARRPGVAGRLTVN